MTTATTILSQLGGNKFLAMTGAKNLLNGGDYLQFDLPRGTKNKASKCRITLNAADLYSVEFFKIRKYEVINISKSENVYNDQLTTIFTNETGLYTKL